MSKQKSVTLFAGVEILPNLAIQHVKEYLKRHCIIDSLGNSLYVKKLGNDSTTFAIEFESDETCKVRKINDEDGHSLDKVIFERDDCDELDSADHDNDDLDYEQI